MLGCSTETSSGKQQNKAATHGGRSPPFLASFRSFAGLFRLKAPAERVGDRSAQSRAAPHQPSPSSSAARGGAGGGEGVWFCKRFAVISASSAEARSLQATVRVRVRARALRGAARWGCPAAIAVRGHRKSPLKNTRGKPRRAQWPVWSSSNADVSSLVSNTSPPPPQKKTTKKTKKNQNYPPSRNVRNSALNFQSNDRTLAQARGTPSSRVCLVGFLLEGKRGADAGVLGAGRRCPSVPPPRPGSRRWELRCPAAPAAGTGSLQPLGGFSGRTLRAVTNPKRQNKITAP